MRVILEYIVCYSSAFGLGMLCGAGMMSLYHHYMRERDETT